LSLAILAFKGLSARGSILNLMVEKRLDSAKITFSFSRVLTVHPLKNPVISGSEWLLIPFKKKEQLRFLRRKK